MVRSTLDDYDSDDPMGLAEDEPAMLTRRRRAAEATINVLPSLLTLGNLLCGFAAVFFASRPENATFPLGWSMLTIGSSFVFMGMVFDGLDGRVARITNRTSDLGEQLDSMADMVTFGVAPAFLAVQLVRVETPFVGLRGDAVFDRVALVIAFIYVACAALRLARFNVQLACDTQQDHMTFVGLPSPGAAGTVASLILLHQHLFVHHDPTHWTIQAASMGMVVVMLLAAIGMVSTLPYSHVVNRYLRGRARFQYVAMVVVLLLLVLVWPKSALAGGFVFYALSAPVMWLVKTARARFVRQT